ncbi:MAG TPA: MaoC family dehydratase N-terminal domain-containing protein, partial [Candidatus Acidoferrum sp.]|nr:MaoC family dehydratase N-terminal domain-containing protein [Candidatus Acidoferrum sp.]
MRDGHVTGAVEGGHVPSGARNSLIPAEALSVVGQQKSLGQGRVVEQEFQRWAAAVGDRNRLYSDAEYALEMGYRGVIAPPLYTQWVLAGVRDLETLNPDGSGPMSGDGIVLPECPRRVAGGEAWLFRDVLYDGDVIRGESGVTGIIEKEGRSGRFVVISTLTSFLRERDGLVVAECARSVIARPAAAGTPVTDTAPITDTAPVVDRPKRARPNGSGTSKQLYFDDVCIGMEIPSLIVAISPIQMFYFSATSYIGHRIHYDKPWATSVEGYPDIVVQGPLQAALMARALADWYGGRGRLVNFQIQNRGIAFQGDELQFSARVTGKRDEGGASLVDLEIQAGNGAGDVLMPGIATIT